MLFLILAILCGSLFSIVFKLCQRHGVDGLQVTFLNYSIAFLFTLLPIIARAVFDSATSAGASSQYLLRGLWLLSREHCS